MDFLTALKKVKEGGKITRDTWSNRDCYVSMHSGFLTIRMAEDGIFHPWTISETDVFAQDWKDADDA